MKFEIEVPEGKNAEWINGVLTLVDAKAKDTRPVTERIKTLQDAIDELGSEHPLVKEYNDLANVSPDIEAYLELRIIVAALNEGWQPKFGGEWRYYPWFKLVSQNDIEDMDEDEKNRVVLRSSDYANTYGGVVCAYANGGASGVHPSYGSRLALKSEELAEYAGTQFLKLYAQFIFAEKIK